MERRAVLSFLAITAFVIFVVGLRDDRQLRIAVEGGLQFEPATIRLRVRVEPDAANRGLAVGVLSPAFESSSWEDLPGTNARITRWFTYTGLPAGEYTAVAEVVRPGEDHWQTETRFQVLSRGF